MAIAFRCSECGREYSYRARLLAHLRRHIHGAAQSCASCGASFATPEALTTHLEQNADGGGGWECPVCFLVVRHCGRLKRHYQQRHEQPARVKLDDGLRDGLQDGVRDGVRDGLRDGLQDGVRDGVRDSLRDGVRDVQQRTVDDDGDGFAAADSECPICGKAFVSKGYVVTHIQTVHFDERSYGCTLCELRFKQSCTLRRHVVKVHVPREAWAARAAREVLRCTVCRATFTAARALRAHVWTHVEQRDGRNGESTKRKAYECKVCFRQYNARSTFYFHKRVHATSLNPKPNLQPKLQSKLQPNLQPSLQPKLKPKPSTPLNCSFCSRGFESRPELNEHVMKQHYGLRVGDDARAPPSPRPSSRPSARPAYRCSQCPRSFLMAGHLANHSRAHLRQRTPSLAKVKVKARVAKLQPLQGSTVDKGHKTRVTRPSLFTDSKAMEQRPYPCSLCPWRFKSPSHMKEHMMTHLGAASFPFACTMCPLRFKRLPRRNEHVAKAHRAVGVNVKAEVPW